eukprot:TRINITY_DN28570_c0_g2_i1.p1 TRINITY_DN28570_c0_g2~~TRINITY_DN28570_c0_g2_i1.p1  ORF type:complete len:795 (+),score=137.20 TRINITY_DN28570_c0_g2_i1:68-2386(+)
MGACCSSPPKELSIPFNRGDEPEDPSHSSTLNFLAEVQLFKRLPLDERPALASCAEDISFAPGQVIIKQGDEGHEFFVIKSGTATVTVDGKQVASLDSGDYFGENALLRDEPRSATIVAATQITALRITRDAFQQLHLNEKLEFAKRGAVAGGIAKVAAIKPPSSKTPEERALMLDALKRNSNLTTVVALDDASANEMIDLMWKDSIPAGTSIITEGDLNADYFYIVQSGEFEISKALKQQSAMTKVAGNIGVVPTGGSFGELALMYLAPRAATIKAKSDAIVWVIDRTQFKDILAKAGEVSITQYVKYLDKVDILSPLKDAEKLELAKALGELSLSKDETVFVQGENGDRFYILIDGTVSVIRDNNEVSKLTATSTSAQFFGEKALLDSAPRNATIKVVSNSATALWVDKQSFDMLLGPLQELKNRGKDGTATVKKVDASAGANAKRFGVILRKDLKRLGLLGCGGFGAVEMVEHTTTGEIYALKALSKGYIIKSGMQASVTSEKDVQLMCDSPFVIKLFETYNGDQSLYLLLECALGGELYATYNKKNLWGRESHAKFYVAGTLFAFEHLHSKKIIFRDLKPENLLLNDAGKIKLTDMGLAKVCVGKTYTTCGTPDYFAPELIASKGHTRAVDWWSLGILTFELMAGHPPFESASPMQIYQKVQKGIHRVVFPRACKGKVESLIKGLCNTIPTERMPMKKGETNNVKKHEWYAGFDWDAMFSLSMDPPYKPHVRNKKDAANFHARAEDMPPQIPYKDPKDGWDANFATST